MSLRAALRCLIGGRRRGSLMPTASSLVLNVWRQWDFEPREPPNGLPLGTRPRLRDSVRTHVHRCTVRFDDLVPNPRIHTKTNRSTMNNQGWTVCPPLQSKPTTTGCCAILGSACDMLAVLVARDTGHLPDFLRDKVRECKITQCAMLVEESVSQGRSIDPLG